jgi:hypothetical protein
MSRTAVLSFAFAALPFCLQAASGVEDLELGKRPAKQFVDRSNVGRGGGPDANIGTDDPAHNDPSKKAIFAGGSPSDQDLFAVNRSAWTVRIYVDGKLRGLLSPGDNYVLPMVPNKTKVYSVVRFPDGGTRSWGPHTFQGSVSWMIEP